MRSFQPFEFFIKCLSSLSSEFQNKKENILTFEILIPSCVVLLVLAFFGMGLILAFYQLFSLCRHHLLLLQKSWMVMSKLLTNSTKIKVVSSIWTLSWLSTIQWPILQVFSAHVMNDVFIPREKWICIDSSLTWKWMGQSPGMQCIAFWPLICCGGRHWLVGLSGWPLKLDVIIWQRRRVGDDGVVSDANYNYFMRILRIQIAKLIYGIKNGPFWKIGIFEINILSWVGNTELVEAQYYIIVKQNLYPAFPNGALKCSLLLAPLWCWLLIWKSFGRGILLLFKYQKWQH